MDLVTAQANLTKWENASAAAAKGQSYSVDGMSLVRVEASTIRSEINFWQKKVNELTDTGNEQTPGVRVASWN